MSGTAIGTPSAPARTQTRLVTALAAVTLLQWLAGSLTLPLLPVWLRGRGASDLAVGLAMGAFFAGAVLAQYPLGRRSDRGAPRALLLGCVAGYALTSAAFLLPLTPGAVIGLRAGQGATAGATEVLALTLIGRCVPAGQRTRSYAAIFAAQTSGLAIGPMLAGLVGVAHMTVLFATATAAASAAVIPLLWTAPATGAPNHLPRSPRPRFALLRPVLAAAAITGLINGVYEACWTLLLDHHGAASWQIGLSWSLFCIPFIAASPLAGPVSDRFGPRRVVLATLCASTALLLVYPMITNIPAVIALGAAEGAATAFAYPAAQTLLAQLAAPGQLGRAQGTVATVQTAATATSAVAGGALFGVAAWLPFAAVAGGGAILIGIGFVGFARGRQTGG
jgi:DHA1 family multidrug resistance protein-like MFS transporter